MENPAHKNMRRFRDTQSVPKIPFSVSSFRSTTRLSRLTRNQSSAESAASPKRYFPDKSQPNVKVPIAAMATMCSRPTEYSTFMGRLLPQRHEKEQSPALLHQARLTMRLLVAAPKEIDARA